MRKMIRQRALFSILVLAPLGCIENTTTHTSSERSDKVASYILKKEPKIEHRLDVKLEGKVTLLGYNLRKTNAKPGGSVDITWFWKCHREIGEGWRLFTHGVDDDGEIKLNRDKVGAIRTNFQPEHWKKGMIIKDQQIIKIPKNWDSGSIELRVGIWSGNNRLKGRGPLVDSANRIKGPRINLGPAKVKKAELPFTAEAPKIDGSFEGEAAWKNALVMTPFANTMTGKPVAKSTQAMMMWDDENLYVAFTAEDELLKSKYEKHDDELWHEDAFEIFLDPKADRLDYYELQVSPKGVVFDSHLPKYRKNQNDWSSKMVAKVKTKGTVNDDDEDEGWSAELAIPFAALEKGGTSPKDGDVWAMNFFRINAGEDRSEYSAWSPPLRGDFHNLSKFGHVTFRKEGTKVDPEEKKAEDKSEGSRDKSENGDKVRDEAKTSPEGNGKEKKTDKDEE